MVINKETDYALRILRALTDGELHTAGQLSQEELLPQAFTYKILKKLERAAALEKYGSDAGPLQETEGPAPARGNRTGYSRRPRCTRYVSVCGYGRSWPRKDSCKKPIGAL